MQELALRSAFLFIGLLVSNAFGSVSFSMFHASIAVPESFVAPSCGPQVFLEP